MQCVHWAAETNDACAVEGLLCAGGISAWTFDAGIVRLDWLKTLAFGGCRVMFADSDAQPARRITDAYRKCEFALAAEHIEPPCCPACHRCAGEEDPAPRRAILLLLIVSDWLLAALFMFIKAPNTMAWILSACRAFNLVLVSPGFAARAIKSRFVCTNCGHAWRALPRLTYQAMSRAIEANLDDSRMAVRAQPDRP